MSGQLLKKSHTLRHSGVGAQFIAPGSAWVWGGQSNGNPTPNQFGPESITNFLLMQSQHTQ
jgi:hypothetical protein